MSNHEQYVGKELSPSEIVMLQLEIRELRDKVIDLEREKFLLINQIDNLKKSIPTNK